MIFHSCFISRHLQSPTLILATASLFLILHSLTPAESRKQHQVSLLETGTFLRVTPSTPDPNPKSSLTKLGNWGGTHRLVTLFVHLSENCQRPQTWTLFLTLGRHGKHLPASSAEWEGRQQTKLRGSNQHAQNRADYGKPFIKSISDCILNNLVALTLGNLRKHV